MSLQTKDPYAEVITTPAQRQSEEREEKGRR